MSRLLKAGMTILLALKAIGILFLLPRRERAKHRTFSETVQLLNRARRRRRLAKALEHTRQEDEHWRRIDHLNHSEASYLARWLMATGYQIRGLSSKDGKDYSVLYR